MVRLQLDFPSDADDTLYWIIHAPKYCFCKNIIFEFPREQMNERTFPCDRCLIFTKLHQLLSTTLHICHSCLRNSPSHPNTITVNLSCLFCSILCFLHLCRELSDVIILRCFSSIFNDPIVSAFFHVNITLSRITWNDFVVDNQQQESAPTQTDLIKVSRVQRWGVRNPLRCHVVRRMQGKIIISR